MANRINPSVSTAYANFFSEQSQTFDKTKEVVNQSNAQTKPQKLSPVEKTVSLTALGCDTELKLARAGYMAAAAKAGIADVGMQGRFADQMLGQNSQLTLNGSELDDAKVKSRLLNQSVDFTITDHEKVALEQFRAQYAKDGGKIRYNRTPTIDLRQARTADGVTNPLNSSPNKKYSVYLISKGNPTDSKRVLAQFAEDQYKGGNLWGENYTRIAEMSVEQGVKPKIVNVKHVGNKVAVEFELTLLDRAKINENYKTVQDQVNEIEKIVAQINKDNPVSQFILGTVNGIKDNLVGTAMMVAHPLETLQTIKEAVVTLSSLTTDDVAKIEKLLESKVKDTLTTRDGINSLPYGAGYALGTVATDVLIGKGVGVALEGLKEIKPIATLLTKLEDLKSLAKVKVAEMFSDEAAEIAGQSAKSRLRQSSSQLNSGLPVDPLLLRDLSIVAGNKLKNGAVKFAEFSDQMVKDLGEKAKPYLEKLYREKMIELGLGKEIDEVGIKAFKAKPPLEGKVNFQVHDPNKVGRTVVDIDRFEGNVLWEEKSATSGFNKTTGANETTKWVSKHITKKFEDLVESRKYLPDFYKDAEIGFDFVKSGVDPNFKAAVEAEIQRLSKLHPDVKIHVNWR